MVPKVSVPSTSPKINEKQETGKKLHTINASNVGSSRDLTRQQKIKNVKTNDRLITIIIGLNTKINLYVEK